MRQSLGQQNDEGAQRSGRAARSQAATARGGTRDSLDKMFRPFAPRRPLGLLNGWVRFLEFVGQKRGFT
jgi:hypothetical protein